jgi:hypothetical protein
MKKIIVVIVFLFSSYLSFAQITLPSNNVQITLQPLLPEVGLFEKSQLWNILVINSSASSQQCYVVLSLEDRQSGAEVMSATSSGFTLERGSKQLNSANLTPIQYTYFSFAGDKTNDFLTVGSYMACFKLMSAGHESAELSEVCVPFDVAPLSPPLLILPADSSVLKVAPSQFTWQPPAPVSMFQQLHYELLIAEIFPGQKPEEAVELNAPFYMDLNVPNNVMNYTGAYPSFEQGKWYAWQVVAEDGQNYATKTQVWDFKVDTLFVPPLNIVDQAPYVKMGRDNIEKGIAPDGILKLSYVNETTDSIATVQIIDLNARGKDAHQFDVSITSGENLIEYDLNRLMTLQAGKVYQAQLINSRKEKWMVQFELYNDKK